jgi:hypothetical protein
MSKLGSQVNKIFIHRQLSISKDPAIIYLSLLIGRAARMINNFNGISRYMLQTRF